MSAKLNLKLSTNYSLGQLYSSFVRFELLLKGGEMNVDDGMSSSEEFKNILYNLKIYKFDINEGIEHLIFSDKVELNLNISFMEYYRLMDNRNYFSYPPFPIKFNNEDERFFFLNNITKSFVYINGNKSTKVGFPRKENGLYSITKIQRLESLIILLLKTYYIDDYYKPYIIALGLNEDILFIKEYIDQPDMGKEDDIDLSKLTIKDFK